MMRFLFRVLVAAAGLWLASKIVPGIYIRDAGTLAAAAILLGVVNALVRPIVVLFTLPFTIITLGLFLLVINAAMLSLASVPLPGFTVHGFFPALLGALVISVVSWVAASLEPRPAPYVAVEPRPRR
jgi:putative membrane protein